MYSSTDILFFSKYLFNDDGHEAPHYGLVIVPSKLTRFKESILCAVMTSKTVRNKYGTHIILAVDYPDLKSDTTIRLRDFDYVPINGLHNNMTQPVTRLSLVDTKKCFKLLKGLLFGNSSPIAKSDPYLRGTILREWKKAISAAS